MRKIQAFHTVNTELFLAYRNRNADSRLFVREFESRQISLRYSLDIWEWISVLKETEFIASGTPQDSVPDRLSGRVTWLSRSWAHPTNLVGCAVICVLAKNSQQHYSIGWNSIVLWTLFSLDSKHFKVSCYYPETNTAWTRVQIAVANMIISQSILGHGLRFWKNCP